MTVAEKPGVSIASEIFKRQLEFSKKLRQEPLKSRKDRLKKLRTWIHANRSRIHEAAYQDFRKAPQEVDGIEIFHVLNEIKLALGNV